MGAVPSQQICQKNSVQLRDAGIGHAQEVDKCCTDERNRGYMFDKLKREEPLGAQSLERSIDKIRSVSGGKKMDVESASKKVKRESKR